MTGAVIVQMFNDLVDDEMDSVLAYQLLNSARVKIEAQRSWNFLKKRDSSNTSDTGGTWETAYALPDDYDKPINLIVGSLGYVAVLFEQAVFYKDNGRYYYVDEANSNFHICGSPGTAETIYFNYIYTPSDVTSITSPVWPERFHALLAYEMAVLYTEGVDADQVTKIMSTGFLRARQELQEQMTRWDATLSNVAMNNMTGRSSYLDSDPSVIHDSLLR